MNKKFGWVIGALVVALLAIGVFGVTSAFADDGVPPGKRGEKHALEGAVLAAVADALKMTPDEVTAALQDGKTLPDLADEAGVDMQDVKDAISAVVGDDGPFGMRVKKRGLDGAALEVVAGVLKMTPEEVNAALQDGKTLSDLAEEAGVDMQDVKSSLDGLREETMREHIAQAVEDGKMSQEKADWLLEGLEKGFLKGPEFFGHGSGFEKPEPPDTDVNF